MSKEFEEWYDNIDHPGPVGYAKRAFEAGQASVSPTLRDQFAMAVVTGISANNFWDSSSFEVIAEGAYRCADAMLKEREK